MSTLQESHAPLDHTIANQLVMATPEWWNSAVLTIDRIEEAGGIEKFRMTIVSPEQHRDMVSVPPDLYEVVMQLADVFRSFGRIWNRAVYKVNLLPNGDWKFSVDFDY